MNEGGERRYQVVIEHNIDDLERRVGELMREGWRPVGGIAIEPQIDIDYVRGTSCQIGVSYLQAMILPAPQTNDMDVYAYTYDEHNQLMNVGSVT